MKTDSIGGSTVHSNLETRLAHHFATELEGAEQDYQTLRSRRGRAAVRSDRAGGTRSRLAGPVFAVGALALVWLIGAGLASMPVTGPAVPPAASDVVRGPDGVPTQIDGQRVYRAVDQLQFPASGAFLLGGSVTKPSGMLPCPLRLDKSTAEQKLVPYCWILSIDGLLVAPMSNLDEPDGAIVVARVHLNDPLAEQCPASDKATCQEGIVVESVVWRSDALAVGSASPAVSIPVASAEGSGGIAPSGSTGPSVEVSSQPWGVDLGPDGVPLSWGPEVVYRAANLPTTASTFLLGGVLGRDRSCAAPTGILPKPPACGYWTIDGLAVGTMVDLPESMIGSVVAVRIERSITMGTCTGGPCRLTDILVVAEILVAITPSPVQPVPSAS
jgi:hypothetical protein